MTNERTSSKGLSGLAEAGLVAAEALPALEAVAERYAVAITPAMVALIDRRDPADPIARQFVPDIRELDTRPGEHADPIGDHVKSPVRGLVHRYPDRVLLKVTSVCPVYCRFCFRREMVGPELGEPMSGEDLARALDYIRAHPQIWEVVLTGGDPLILSPRRIAEIGEAMAGIAHVRVLRWHTRVPVVAPERVTVEIITALRAFGRGVWIGLHANHARELTANAHAACRRLAAAGIPLVSQSVLLRGVNDSVEALDDLMRAFVEAGVKPYYLHHADLAPGTSHFRTTIAEGQRLMRELRGRLSGLAMPQYVIDIPGAHGKVPAGAAHVEHEPGRVRLIDAAGAEHRYADIIE